MIFFTSDLHFGHRRLIELQRQQFSSVEEMDQTIIERWREVVKPSDEVYVLGDVSFYRGEKTVGILKQLPGQKHLVPGNHDKGMQAYIRNKQFLTVDLIKEIKVQIPKGPLDAPFGFPSAHEGRLTFVAAETVKQHIVLCHYPMVTWNASSHGSWHLHGHCHGNLREELLPPARRLDVGVDAWDYYPVALHDVAVAMDKKGFSPVDHHGTDRDYDAPNDSESEGTEE